MDFELDPANRMVEIETLPGTTEIVSLGIGPVPEGLQRSRFLAVADIDNKVKIYSLNPNGMFVWKLSLKRVERHLYFFLMYDINFYKDYNYNNTSTNMIVMS